MQQLTVKIPDNKLSFFMELIQSLGYVQVEKKSENPVLTDQQIRLVEEERSKMKADPDSMIDWEEGRKMLHVD